MKIPNELKINGITYAVRQQLLNDCGNFDAKKQLIILADDLTDSMLELTLWHEAIHAYNHEYSEEETERLAQMIVAIINDNKLYG